MLKLKDIHIGSLVMDTSGIYEVTNVDRGHTSMPYTVREVIDGETETYGVEFSINRFDMKHKDLIG